MGGIKTILITGATGFLGSHLLQLLIDKDYLPIVYLRPTSDTWRITHLQGRYQPFIANNANDLSQLFTGNQIDAIIHTATEYGRQSKLSAILNTNVLFPIKLIEAGLAHGVKMFINTDTFFGKKQFDLKYLGNYTSSKRVLEGFLMSLCTPQFSIANLRIEHVYGGNDGDQKFVPAIIKQALQNQAEIGLTTGLQKRDFVYVKDVANAYLSILTAAGLAGYNEFEVGTGQSVTVKEFILKIAQITGTHSVLNFGSIPTREGEIADSFANITPLKQLGWKPAYTIEQGLIATINSEKSITYDNA